MKSVRTIVAEDIRPLHDKVFVTDLEGGQHITRGGIITLDDNMTQQGIRPRWAKVWKVGPEVVDLHPGEWIYIQHGRWTNSIDVDIAGAPVRFWMVENTSIELVSDVDPRPQKYSTASLFE